MNLTQELKSFLWKRYFNTREQILLWLILIIGIIARLVIAFQSQLWRDEVYFFDISRTKSIFDLVFQNYWDTVHPSFYYIVIHFWQKISIDPLFLRFPGIIFSFFILYLIPILAIKIFPRNKPFAFILLILYGLSQTQISLNVVVRPYPLVIFLTLISLILFIDILSNKNISKNKIIFFALINGLIGYTDYSGVWLIISYYCFAPLFLIIYKPNKRFRKNILLALGVTIFTAIPWLLLFFRHLPNTLEIPGRNLSPFFDKNINILQANLWQLRFFSSTLYSDILIRLNLLSDIGQSILFIILSIIGIILSFRENKIQSLLIFVILFFPLIASFLFSLMISPIFLGRNLHVVSLMLLFGLAYLLSSVYRHRSLLTFVFLIMWAANFISSDKIIHHVDPPYDWKGVAQVISVNQNVTMISDEPYYIFDPIKYYSRLKNSSINIEILHISELNTINKNTIIYLINTVSAKQPQQEKNDLFQQLAYQSGCKLHETTFDYISLAQCKFTAP